MKKFSMVFLVAVTLGIPAGPLRAAPVRSFEARQLKKQHKAQRKALKQQQRAMKNVMGQHELSGDQRQRFSNDLKMQKGLLHKNQKTDSRHLKQTQKFAKAASHAESE